MNRYPRGAGDDAYLPIAEHGLIGDLRTAALVGTDGRIDWFCAPRFDSPSVFGALLDAERGGSWRIDPLCEVAARRQFYFPDTNILVTRLLTEHGMVEVQDFMPVLRPHDPDHRQRLVRRVVCVRGEMRLRTRVAPRLDYGRAEHRAVEHGQAVEFRSDAQTVTVRGTVPLTVDTDGDPRDAVAEFHLAQGDEEHFVLEGGEPAAVGADDSAPAGDPRRDTAPLAPEDVAALFDGTVAYWRGWLKRSTYTGRWREMVQRSALTLKLLTHEPTGAVIAAPTLGLPEVEGGERNWDYRYVWIRDAAFSLYALLRLGFTQEADAFVGWLTRCLGDADGDGKGPLRALYTIDGDPAHEETHLDHLDGYRGSLPVRVGNQASEQCQLDVYGELVDSVYLFNKHGAGISLQAWKDLTRILEWLLENWDQADESIWETRAGRQHHTYSRLMCWVAVERMIRMSRQRGLPGDVVRWSRVRDEIHEQIVTRAWSPELQSFVQTTATDAPPPPVLDASLLVMPMVKFLAPTDPLFVSTMDAIERGLVADSLVFRYDPRVAPDGLTGTEGTFSICSFWWVEALTRTGRVEEARIALEKTFTYSNHLGLYAEQIAMTGEQLGNFPQAFTHLALISAAVNLDRAMP
ncbi:glycoside hydrolase family 15 protein [Streptomyces sp. NPDC060194]|uniref:glycoside hydrolase family 15 protein n=1 Tax=Streptomyces sp. NPDC060194 TaxID=3347069 RepID=UPI00365362B4